MFKLNQDADVNMTHKMGSTNIAPITLVSTFGPPISGDEYKSSGEYYFEDDDGNVYTVYDWKSTSLYDPSCPTPEEFWESDSPEYFSIGGRGGDVQGFIEWLTEQTA